jgi:hypothetical protein
MGRVRMVREKRRVPWNRWNALLNFALGSATGGRRRKGVSPGLHATVDGSTAKHLLALNLFLVLFRNFGPLDVGVDPKTNCHTATVIFST